MARVNDDSIGPPAVPSANGGGGRMDSITATRALGHVRLRDRTTKEIVLIPAPTADPNDPLNWPQWYKYYIAGLTCTAIMMANFLAAGPTVAIADTAVEFLPHAPFPVAIGRVAYFFTTTALLQGVGNFLWVPLANKFGKRPVYVGSYLIYLGSVVWLIFERSYPGFLAGRIVMGFGSGASETISALVIADLFFLHERGAIMGIYTAFLSMGVGLGIILSGLITIHHNWRVIYCVSAALVGTIFLLVLFTFPETTYARGRKDTASLWNAGRDPLRFEPGKPATPPPPESAEAEVALAQERHRPRQSYGQSLRLYGGTFTRESLGKMFLRPLGLIALPPVLWAALVQAVTIGFLVAVSSNIAPAFQQAYGFAPWQVGLCFLASIVGSLLGIPAGGHAGDRVADYFTDRNGGIREPEMRLPAVAVSVVTTPLGLVLFGLGVYYRLHWICPTIGLGLLNFSITQATNICLVYVIDAYRPVAGEITLTVMGFKSIFGFLLSFYTNPWVNRDGYKVAYGEMAGIAAAVLVLFVPLYLWGKQIRRYTWNWSLLSRIVHWADDREVGE